MKRVSKEIINTTVRSLAQESDRGCVILGCSALQGILEQVHEAFIAANLTGKDSPKHFFVTLKGTYGPLSSFNGQIDIAFAYGLISKSDYEALHMVRALRNEAAHCGFEFRFEDSGVKSLLAKLATHKSYEVFLSASQGLPILSSISESKRSFILSVMGLRDVLLGLQIEGVERILNKRKGRH